MVISAVSNCQRKRCVTSRRTIVGIRSDRRNLVKYLYESSIEFEVDQNDSLNEVHDSLAIAVIGESGEPIQDGEESIDYIHRVGKLLHKRYQERQKRFDLTLKLIGLKKK